MCVCERERGREREGEREWGQQRMREREKERDSLTNKMYSSSTVSFPYRVSLFTVFFFFFPLLFSPHGSINSFRKAVDSERSYNLPFLSFLQQEDVVFLDEHMCMLS